MIKVSNLVEIILNQLRAGELSGYNESEIRYFLNAALKIMSNRLDLSIKNADYECCINKCDFSYPKDLIKPKKIYVNNKNIQFLSFEELKKCQINTPYALILANCFRLHNLNTKDKKITLIYTANVKLKDNDNYIDINASCEDALFYYAMSRANEKVLSDRHLNRAMYFKKLFDDELRGLTSILSYNKTQKLTTKYIKV